MDFNIAAAFWFASRGRGRLYQPAAVPPPLLPPLQTSSPLSPSVPTPLTKHASAVPLHSPPQAALIPDRILGGGETAAELTRKLSSLAVERSVIVSATESDKPAGGSAKDTFTVPMEGISRRCVRGSEAVSCNVDEKCVVDGAGNGYNLHSGLPGASADVPVGRGSSCNGRNKSDGKHLPGVGAHGDVDFDTNDTSNSLDCCSGDPQDNVSDIPELDHRCTSKSDDGMDRSHQTKDVIKKKPKKVNRNMEELCPVEGCRHLLKPGCVFGTCSNCCLKAQQLVVTHIAAQNSYPSLSSTQTAATSEMMAKSEQQPIGVMAKPPLPIPSPPATTKVFQPVAEKDDMATAAPCFGGSGGVTDVLAAAAATQQQQEDRLASNKARAKIEAARALKEHLAGHFEEFSQQQQGRHFSVEALAAVLQRKLCTRSVKSGRDIHVHSRARVGRPDNTTGGNALQSSKLCAVHKSSVNSARVKRDIGTRGAPCNTRCAVGCSEGTSGEFGCMSAEVYCSEAKVLLVGIGADEFMGGYSRHRNVYKRGGKSAQSSTSSIPWKMRVSALGRSTVCFHVMRLLSFRSPI